MGICRFIGFLALFLFYTGVVFAEPVIQVGVSDGVPEFVGQSQGKLNGALSSVYECVFEKSGLEPHYVSIPLKRGLYYLKRGELDVLLPLARTPERDQSMVFAGELVQAEYSYVSFKPLPTDIAGSNLKFGLVRGFAGHVFVPESAPKTEDVTSWSQLVPMLDRGRIDVSVVPTRLVDIVLGERAKEAFLRKSGELSASMYISPRHKMSNVSFRIMNSVEACRTQEGILPHR